MAAKADNRSGEKQTRHLYIVVGGKYFHNH